MLKRIINRGRVRIFLWILSVVLIFGAVGIEYYTENSVRDLPALKIESSLDAVTNNVIAVKSKWLLYESIHLLPQRTINKIKEAKAAFYLLENDSIVRWWGDNFTKDINPVLVDTSAKLVDFDGKKILIRRQKNKNRSAALAVVLLDDEKPNREIFFDADVKLARDLTFFNSSHLGWHKINFGESSFWVESQARLMPPFVAYVMGWIGIVLLLSLLVYKFKTIATSKNAIVVNIISFIALATIRILLFVLPISIFNGDINLYYEDGSLNQFLFAPSNLILSIFIVLLQSYLYYSTGRKVSENFKDLNIFCRVVTYFSHVIYRCVILVYVHWAIVENIYNPQINTDLFNILSINLGGVLLYISCGLYFVARLFQHNIISSDYYKNIFKIDTITSIPILLLFLCLLQDQLHGTWFIAIVYSIGFRAIVYLYGKLKPITTFTIAVAFTAIYLTCLVSLESMAAREVIAKEYQYMLSSKSKKEITHNTEKNQFADFRYVVINQYKFDIANDNQLELWNVMRFINCDTIIKMGNYQHKITPMKDKSLIVSYKRLMVLDVVALFCYVFFTIFIIAFIVGTLFHIKFPDITQSKISLVVKIQTMVLGIVIVAVATASVVSINYTIDSTDASNRKTINNLLQTVQNSITNYEIYDTNPMLWLQNWYNISGKGLTQNMAVYDTRGRLIIGHPKEFHSYLMDSEAIRFISYGQKPYYGKNDFKDDVAYYTLYFPVHHNDKLFGYVVLAVVDPRNQPDAIPITEELLNMFVVVLFVVLWMSVLLNYFVTKPLKIVQEALSTVNLMRKIPLRKNSAYNYEVNAVISMYNEMIDTIRRNNIEIAQIERQNAWQDMARQIAHDIKNPLTPIQLKIQILKRKIDNNSPDIISSAYETIDIIQTQIERINYVVEQFREFAAVGGYKMEIVDLVDVISKEVATYDLYENVNVVFENRLDKVVNVYGERDQFGRVIGNLCKNAIESIPGDRDGMVRVVLREEGMMIVVEVIDNGEGISEEVAKRLFTPSFTTKATGSGLGLPICKRIVEQYNGDIKFENNPHGEGSTFIITLPPA